jgi:hypothetical protein
MKYLVFAIMLLLPVAALAKGECRADKEKFCADIVKADGDVGACLEQHKAELSEACLKKREANEAEKTETRTGQPAKPGASTETAPAEAPSPDTKE